MSRREFTVALASGSWAVSFLAAKAQGIQQTTGSSLVKATFAGGRNSSGIQRLSLDPAYHLRVLVSINGVDTVAMLDSGAARTIIDTRFAAKLGLLTRGGFDVVGITGDRQGQFAEGMAITIGDMTLTGIAGGALDLSSLSSGMGPAIDLVLGRDVFSRTVVDIDFRREQINFLNVDGGPIPPISQAIPLTDTLRGTPHIPALINGRSRIDAGFDLGYNATLLLSPRYVDDMNLLAGKRVSTVASQGIEGQSVNRLFTLDTLTLGEVTIANVPVESPPNWNRTIPGIIGLEIFKRFHLTTDYPHSRIWLSPDRQLAKTPLPKDRSGIGALPGPDGLSILHVALGSPAQLAGLKAGDRIVMIDGETVDTDYVRKHPRMGTRPEGTQFVLTLSNGREIKFTLAEYY